MNGLKVDVYKQMTAYQERFGLKLMVATTGRDTIETNKNREDLTTEQRDSLFNLKYYFEFVSFTYLACLVWPKFST